jgi:lipopolysaccharide/colanic/teichoic acid biosynthesis glycosyltransferase
MKRMFDVVIALLGLVLLSPLLLLAALLTKLDSKGPIFFRQERMGRRFRPFFIYKFRTMTQHAPATDGLLTVGEDSRITRVGQFLRKTKIDELPQLLNVLKGEMTVVGPRPEVRQFVELFRADYEEILKIRPGITDLASLKYRDEATLLGRSKNPAEDYVTKILPDKIRLGKEYIKNSSLFFDLTLILKTLLKLVESRFQDVISRPVDHSESRSPSTRE